jgi:hypothetical protein
VKVKLETGPEAVAGNVQKGAFVLLGGKDVAVRKFDTLAEAVLSATDGDAIEIRGNRPFVTEPLHLGSKALVIRAGAGSAPVILRKAVPNNPNTALLKTLGPLTLEGLELGFADGPEFSNPCLINSSYAPLYLTNCKLVLHCQAESQPKAINTWESSPCQVRNCLIVSPAYGILAGSTPRTQWTVENCLITAWSAFAMQPLEESSPATKLRLNRNTFASGVGLTLMIPDELAASVRGQTKPVVPASFESEDNVWQTNHVLELISATPKHPKGLPLEELRRILPEAFLWRERSNVYGLDTPWFCFHASDPDGILKDLAEWNEFWGLKDSNSQQSNVLLRGQPLKLTDDNPRTITRDDFRLRVGSAGYRAGKDGKDLGADVDLVGPGAAYERWKKAPEFKEWLKETGQEK